MAISEQWAHLLEPGLRSIFNKQKEAIVAESRIPSLFNVMSSQKAQEHFLGVGGFGDWNAYDGVIEYDDNAQGYKTTLTHEEYTRGFKVSRKLVDDDQYSIINPQPRGLAMAATRTQEKHAASVFNNAFSSSYTGGDSVSLCNASHPYSPVDATVHGNAGSSALSYDTVVATKKLMRLFVDDRGELITVLPKTLLVPPALEDTAWTIVNSMNKPGTANNDANYVGAQGLKVIVDPYLTSAVDWFMVDSRLSKMHLLWFNRELPEINLDPASDYNLVARYAGYMRYSFGWDDFRFIYGHNV